MHQRCCGIAFRLRRIIIPGASNNATSDAGAAKGSKTFKCTGKEQTFTVPVSVTQLTVVAIGGEGGGFNVYPSTATPGRPGRVYGIVPVHGGEKLYVFVGGSGAHGGFNGGGAGGNGGLSRKPITGNPGGGASDVRTAGKTLLDRIVVAAGGGGAGEAIDNYADGYGGNGGGLVGKSGGGTSSDYSGGGGSGGTQSAGGSGGSCGGRYGYGNCGGQPGGSGALGAGGNGGDGSGQYNVAGGGGGGGGYYGGGGGGGGGQYDYSSHYGNTQSGGGGGGSSYVEPGAIKSRMWTGWKWEGDGLVVFSWN